MLDLIHFTDPRLKASNEEIKSWTDDLAVRVRQMFELMYRTGGVGLAAPQIGWNVRLFILNLTGKRENERIFWSPKVSLVGNVIAMEEACLSYPGLWLVTQRSTEVVLMAQSPGGPVQETFEGFGAKAIQHEVDHLNGITILERIDAAQRRAIDRKLKTLA